MTPLPCLYYYKEPLPTVYWAFEHLPPEYINCFILQCEVRNLINLELFKLLPALTWLTWTKPSIATLESFNPLTNHIGNVAHVILLSPTRDFIAKSVNCYFGCKCGRGSVRLGSALDDLARGQFKSGSPVSREASWQWYGPPVAKR